MTSKSRVDKISGKWYNNTIKRKGDFQMDTENKNTTTEMENTAL